MTIQILNEPIKRISFTGKKKNEQIESCKQNKAHEDLSNVKFENLNLEGIDSKDVELVNKKLGIATAKQTYKQLAQENNISSSTVRRKIKQTVTKAELKNNIQKPRINDFVKNFKETFDCKNISDKQILEIIEIHPDLANIEFKKIKSNIRTVVETFFEDGLNEKDYLKAALKKPNLFYQKPETIISNINELVDIFKEQGLSKSDYLKAALKQPNLFYQSPPKVEQNIKGPVNAFEKQGLTLSVYIKAATKSPQLFSLAPETVVNNINETVKKLEKDGLTLQDYLKAASVMSTLFTMSPDIVESHIRTIVEKFKDEGLTTQKYIHNAIKQPNLFAQSPETIEKHIKLYKYLVKNKLYDENSETKSKAEILDMAMKYPLGYSDKHIYAKILNNKIFNSLKQPKFVEPSLEKKLEEFIFKNKDKTFSFNVLDGEYIEEFLEHIETMSQKNARRNIFDITVV